MKNKSTTWVIDPSGSNNMVSFNYMIEKTMTINELNFKKSENDNHMKKSDDQSLTNSGKAAKTRGWIMWTR